VLADQVEASLRHIQARLGRQSAAVR
jgi:hypothetical protein